MFQPDLLNNKRILITGGGTGLGKGMAQRFLELGATVYICGRRQGFPWQSVADKSRLHSITFIDRCRGGSGPVSPSSQRGLQEGIPFRRAK